MIPRVLRWLPLAIVPGACQDSGPVDLKALYQTKVVLATQTLLDAMQVPGTVVTVTADQIRARGYRSLSDLLRELPEIQIGEGVQATYYNLVTVRGVAGQMRLILLLDGVRIGAAANEPVPFLENFPLPMAKRVEVLYGPASALYGADAFTAVVNIVPFDPGEGGNRASLWGGDDGRVGAHLRWGGALGGTELQGQVAGQMGRDGGVDMAFRYPDYRGNAALATGTFQTVFGPNTPGFPIATRYAQPLRSQALMAELGTREVAFVLFANAWHFPSGSSFNPDNSVKTEAPYLAGRTLMGSLGWTLQPSETVECTTRLTGRTYDVDPGSNFINVLSGMEPGYKYARSQDLRLEGQVTWKTHRDLLLAMGLAANRYDAIPFSTDLVRPVDLSSGISGEIPGLPPGGNAADFFHVTGQVLGGFLQAQYQPDLRWSLTLGGRYERDSRFGATWTPRLGLVWTPTGDHSVKLLYGTAFLAPSPFRAFQHYGSFRATGPGTYASSFWHLPNPGLQPERERTLELSYRVVLLESLGVTAAFHHTALSDLHTSISDAGNTNLYGGTYKGWPVSFIEVTGNQGRQVNQGWMVNGDLMVPTRIGTLSAYASWSQIEGRVEGQGGRTGEAGLLTPRMIKAGVDLRAEHGTLSIAAAWIGPQRTRAWSATDPSTRGRVAGYRDLVLRGSWSFRPWMELFFRVDNVLDEALRHVGEDSVAIPGSFPGTPQAGRRWSAGIRASF